jgi:hypothetical protein
MPRRAIPAYLDGKLVLDKENARDIREEAFIGVLLIF